MMSQDAKEDDVMETNTLKNMPEDSQDLALDDDALDSVAGGAGSNSEKNVEYGTVVAPMPNGIFQVNLDNGNTVNAAISGKLRMNYIRISIGDRVEVEVYEGSYSRIISRYRNS